MSSITKHLVERFGPRIKIAGFTKKTSTIRSATKITQILKSYIDDRTKEDYPVPDEISTLSDSDFIEALFSGNATLREGKDITGTLEESRVTLGGFLASELEKDTLNSEKDVLDLIDYWDRKGVGSHRKKGSHFIFSQDPRISAKFTEHGQSSHSHLLATVRETLSQFEAQFHPNDSIGYVLGFHADRHHPHIHALIYPKLESGKEISLCRGGRLGEDHMDFQGFIKRQFNQNSWDRYLEHIIEPELVQRKRIAAERSPIRLANKSLVIMAAHEEATEQENPNNLPLRVLLPEAKKTILGSTDRDEILESVRQRRMADHLKFLSSAMENPEQTMEVTSKLLEFMEDSSRLLYRSAESAVVRRQRIEKMMEDLKDDTPMEPERSIEEMSGDWKNVMEYDSISSTVAEYTCTLFSEVASRAVGQVPNHLKEPVSPDEYQPTIENDRKVQSKFFEIHRIRLTQRNKTLPLEDLKNRNLFDHFERSKARKSVEFATTLSERIANGLSPLMINEEKLMKHRINFSEQMPEPVDRTGFIENVKGISEGLSLSKTSEDYTKEIRAMFDHQVEQDETNTFQMDI